jgi:hypothetical protein
VLVGRMRGFTQQVFVWVATPDGRSGTVLYGSDGEMKVRFADGDEVWYSGRELTLLGACTVALN